MNELYGPIHNETPKQEDFLKQYGSLSTPSKSSKFRLSSILNRKSSMSNKYASSPIMSPNSGDEGGSGSLDDGSGSLDGSGVSDPVGSVHPQKQVMKKHRKRVQTVGAVGGAVVGGLVLGPVGAVVGGAAGGVATNKIHKSRERASQRKYEQASFQTAANESLAHSSGAFV